MFGAENSLSDYKIVRAGWASDNAATQLASKLKSTYGAELPVVTDSEPETECEFVIGVTNRGTAGTEAGKMTGAYSKFGKAYTVDRNITNVVVINKSINFCENELGSVLRYVRGHKKINSLEERVL